MKSIKYFIAVLLMLFQIVNLGAQDSGFTIVVNPKVIIPLRESSDLFSVGGGVSLLGNYDFNAPFYLKGGFDYGIVPSYSSANLNLISGIVGGGLRLGMGKLMDYRLGISGGGYYASYKNLSAWSPLVSGETGFQFNFSKAVQASIMGAYDYYIGEINTSPSFSESAMFEGVSINLGITINPGGFGKSGERRSLMDISDPDFDLIFPVFYQYYNNAPLGSVKIKNNEKHAISDVKVSFFVTQYMEAPKLCLEIDEMERGEVVNVPLYGLFKDSVLGITEATSVGSQVIVEYKEGDDYLTKDRSGSIKLYNRNNMTWDDDRKAAAFVNANDPTVLRFARNIASSIRNEGTSAVNENLRNAMAIFQSLNLYGMQYVVDPDSSYIELSENETAMDFLQFPQQTLDYRTGDCDDLSILYSSLLESVGIRTSFITIPGHIYMAFALNMDVRKAERTFSHPEDLIVLDDEVWVPVEITMMNSDFLSAWSRGAKEWRENNSDGSAAMYVIRDAWKIYPPTGFSSDTIDIHVPQTPEVLLSYSKVLNTFIMREIGPRKTDLEQRIADSNNNPRLINRLGTLYARYGLYDEAEEQFKLAVAETEYIPALINLGNIAYLNGAIKTAQDYYFRAYSVKDDNPRVLINLARVHFDQEEYVNAQKRYKEAEVLDPAVAERYSYIVSGNSDTARASAAADRDEVFWDEE